MNKSLTAPQKMANRLVKKNGLKVPIDIEQLLIQRADWEEDNIPFNGDAICINREERPLVISDITMPTTRKRFTLAHELGHIVIPWHTGMISCHTINESDIKMNEYYQIELQANEFAAELLMPSEWVCSLIESYEGQELKSLINAVCSQAEVSFLAALYKVFELLPKGYIAFVEHKERGYTQTIKSNNTEVTCLRKNGSIDVEWLRFNSTNYGKIIRDTEDVYWFNLRSGATEEDIKGFIGSDDVDIDISHLLEQLKVRQDKNIATMLELIKKSLPRGYVIRVSSKESIGTNIYIRSKETTVYPPHQDDERTKANWLNRYCTKRGSYEYHSYKIEWWWFKIEMPDHNKMSDTRPSTDILRNIIECNYEKKHRQSIYGKINGVIGLLNTYKERITFEEFYSLLKLKFLGREDIQDIIEDDNFDIFLINKVKELLNRRQL